VVVEGGEVVQPTTVIIAREGATTTRTSTPHLSVEAEAEAGGDTTITDGPIEMVGGGMTGALMVAADIVVEAMAAVVTATQAGGGRKT
jgi:hypothetical protein